MLGVSVLSADVGSEGDLVDPKDVGRLEDLNSNGDVVDPGSCWGWDVITVGVDTGEFVVGRIIGAATIGANVDTGAMLIAIVGATGKGVILGAFDDTSKAALGHTDTGGGAV
jgi:hypothetical protein